MDANFCSSPTPWQAQAPKTTKPAGRCGQRWASTAPWWPLPPQHQPLWTAQPALHPPAQMMGTTRMLSATMPTPDPEFQPPHGLWEWIAWAGGAQSSLTGFSPRWLLSPWGIASLFPCKTQDRPPHLSDLGSLPCQHVQATLFTHGSAAASKHAPSSRAPKSPRLNKQRGTSSCVEAGSDLSVQRGFHVSIWLIFVRQKHGWLRAWTLEPSGFALGQSHFTSLSLHFPACKIVTLIVLTSWSYMED